MVGPIPAYSKNFARIRGQWWFPCLILPAGTRPAIANLSRSNRSALKRYSLRQLDFLVFGFGRDPTVVQIALLGFLLDQTFI
jgi:hypothetical protein